MIQSFFPLKKIRRNGKYLLFGTILVVGVLAVYHEFVAANAWSPRTRVYPAVEDSIWRRTALDRGAGGDCQEDSAAAWRSSYIPQPWKPEYKGQANLHVFEDWCGSSIAQLHNNLHYPLYPHSRTTVQKLAVSPQWNNYGLRIFGYLHPYTDGEFVFAVSSDDNSEFWLSQDDSPLNLQLLAWVGKSGTEWTAPGEFEKYASQTTRPVRLSSQRRYYFEVIHKQNDRGTDHVEVGWQLNQEGLRFTVIGSSHISLYTNESALLMSDVTHIPQTAASHTLSPSKQPSFKADMLRDDPRDTFHQVPLINNRYLQGVLPDCSYKPSYIIKGFPLLRYQGLQFVHMSYIYPNDYTRLTHMETENSCFYHESPFYLERFGFSKYMRPDRPEGQEREDRAGDFEFQRHDVPIDEQKEDEEAPPRVGGVKQQKRKVDNALLPDYGDDYDDYAQRRKRKLFSIDTGTAEDTLKNLSDTGLHTYRRKRRRPAGMQKGVVVQRPTEQLRLAEHKLKKPADVKQPKPALSVSPKPHTLQEQKQVELKLEKPMKPAEHIKPTGRPRPAKRQKRKPVETNDIRPKQKHQLIPVERDQARPEEREPLRVRPVDPSQRPLGNSTRRRVPSPVKRSEGDQVQSLKDLQPKHLDRNASVPERPIVAQKRRYVNRTVELQPAVTKHSRVPLPDIGAPLVRLNQRDAVTRNSLRNREIELNVPLAQDVDNSIHRTRTTAGARRTRDWLDARGVEEVVGDEGEVHRGAERRGENDSLWGPGGDSEGGDEDELNYDLPPAPVFDPEVNWSQTFQVNQLDLQELRSDWIDLRCNVSGNIILRPSDAHPIVKSFMEKLNHKHHGRFTLVRVVNVEKRLDGVQGSRYLLELELKDVNGQLLRLSHYIYALIRHKRPHSRGLPFQRYAPESLLCNPVGFHWNPTATVHFIVPVKNQARWVQQLIVDMETLYRNTGDPNFNLIITDYNSTDMDVEKALQSSTLLRYQYVKLNGNFERSAGLQAGINLISDDHSIVFLCDLHIHFPSSIVDTVRKHCVEGYMAFAPIVMRLDCGATPLEPRGYWEVNGFGLLGIYKSDLVAAGGMNTKDFTDRWGGEDWELLDRILQSGLEVERIYLRNFFHHYHSKRGMWNRRTLPNPR